MLKHEGQKNEFEAHSLGVVNTLNRYEFIEICPVIVSNDSRTTY